MGGCDTLDDWYWCGLRQCCRYMTDKAPEVIGWIDDSGAIQDVDEACENTECGDGECECENTECGDGGCGNDDECGNGEDAVDGFCDGHSNGIKTCDATSGNGHRLMLTRRKWSDGTSVVQTSKVMLQRKPLATSQLLHIVFIYTDFERPVILTAQQFDIAASSLCTMDSFAL